MSSHRRSLATIVGLVAVSVAIWILASPPSAGPDEPDHIVRAAALVRGELDGTRSEFSGAPAFELPPWTGWPDPGCFAQQPFNSASCATSLPRPAGQDVEFDTRSADYPVWGHVLPGLGTLLPASVSNLGARVMGAALPILLVGSALFVSTRRGWLSVGSALLALTPMAWFMFAVVNPSSLVIAGGFGLWIGLDAIASDPVRTHRWLAAGAWAALVLPRRDGMVWAMLILSIDMIVAGRSPRAVWASLGRAPQVLVVASTLATIMWAATTDSSSSQLLVVTPLILCAVLAARWAWRRPQIDSAARKCSLALGYAIVVVVGTAVVMSRRPGGFDSEVLRIIIGRTGLHLDEAIGVLGWLDTPIPATLAMLWLVVLGVVFAAALAAGRFDDLMGAGAVLGSAVLAPWGLEMAQGDPSGTYWQGRYSLPLLMGIPLLMGRADHRSAAIDARLGRCVAAMALVIGVGSLGSSIRRWAVGIGGSMLPWDWNTYDTLVPPVIYLVGSAAVAIAMWRWATRLLAQGGERPHGGEAGAACHVDTQ